MNINKVNIYKISLPFTGDFSHSRKKGFSANNIIVEVLADKGKIKGYGEGAPRLYVTGESQESVTKSINYFLQKDSFPWELNNVSQIWDFVDSLSNSKEHNSAICALEMALLDSLSKNQNKPALEYFQQDFCTSTIYYGATVPLVNKQRAIEVCRLIEKIRIDKLRLKMGKDLEQNKEAIKTVRLFFGNNCDLRIDINGAWDYELALKHVPLVKEYNVKIVEQPMMPDDPDIADLSSTMQTNGIILMADEAACSLREVETIVTNGWY